LVKVKICGITNLEDALNAVRAGADLLGFNFYPKSSRYLPLEEARKIAQSLPPFVFKVGVFVNEKREAIEKAIHTVKLDYIQLHGDESAEDCLGHACSVIKAFHAGEDIHLMKSFEGKIAAALIDSPHEGNYGGTGKVFDWKQIDKLGEMPYPLILSGGLNAQNVADAVQKVKPYAVDACSQLESKPGKKDIEKVKKFIRNAKGAE
jgi:phosphoribosylanthranilate isomerase